VAHKIRTLFKAVEILFLSSTGPNLSLCRSASRFPPVGGLSSISSVFCIIGHRRQKFLLKDPFLSTFFNPDELSFSVFPISQDIKEERILFRIDNSLQIELQGAKGCFGQLTLQNRVLHPVQIFSGDL